MMSVVTCTILTNDKLPCYDAGVFIPDVVAPVAVVEPYWGLGADSSVSASRGLADITPPLTTSVGPRMSGVRSPSFKEFARPARYSMMLVKERHQQMRDYPFDERLTPA